MSPQHKKTQKQTKDNFFPNSNTEINDLKIVKNYKNLLKNELRIDRNIDKSSVNSEKISKEKHPIINDEIKDQSKIIIYHRIQHFT